MKVLFSVYNTRLYKKKEERMEIKGQNIEIKGCLHGCCQKHLYVPLVVLAPINCKRIKSTLLFNLANKFSVPRVVISGYANDNSHMCLIELMQNTLQSLGIRVGFGNEDFFCHYFSWESKTRIMTLFLDTSLKEADLSIYLNNNCKLVKNRELAKPLATVLSSYNNRIDVLTRDLDYEYECE